MDLTRQLDLVDVDKLAETPIMIIGAGGIGSFAAATLAKMGASTLQIWDKDHIEPHNIPNQNYSPNQEGMIKVEALRNNIVRDTGIMPRIENAYWEGNLSFNPEIIITAVDSMDIRFHLWDIFKRNPPTEGTWLLDARMASRAMSLYVCRFGDDDSIAAYEKNALFPSDEADKEPCTAKAIIHTCLACSYMVANTVHDVVNNKDVHRSYHGELLHFYLSKEKDVVK